MENMIDVIGNENEAENEEENEHEDLEDVPMKNDGADAERDDTMDPDTVSNTMDKQYGAWTQTNMRARKRKSDLPPKLRIHPPISSKRSKILHANAIHRTGGKAGSDSIFSLIASLH